MSDAWPTVGAWERMLNAFRWGEYRVRADAVGRLWGVVGEGVVTKDRRIVGKLGVTARRDTYGRLYVQLDRGRLDEPDQGLGGMGAFVIYLESAARALGARYMRGRVAGRASYALAGMGFELEEPDTLPAIVALAFTDVIDNLTRAGDIPVSLRRDLDTLRRKVDSGDIDTIADLADYGRERAQVLRLRFDIPHVVTVNRSEKWWAGKLVLLCTHWQGYKPLQAVETIRAAAR